MINKEIFESFQFNIYLSVTKIKKTFASLDVSDSDYFLNIIIEFLRYKNVAVSYLFNLHYPVQSTTHLTISTLL